MVKQVLVAGMAALGLIFAPWLCAQTPASPAEEVVELDTVLVTGEQPGPGLWKVSRDGHVLWILGSYGPLPRDMKWRSKEVEARVAASQLVLYPGRVNVSADIGILRGLTLLPGAIRAAKNPDGAKLAEVLPAEVYAKWRVLKLKYLGKDNDIEEYRPIYVANRLRSEATRKSGLGAAVDIRSVVNKAAKKNRVRIQELPTVTRKVHIEDPRGMLKSVSKVELGDVECFSKGLDRLEPDLAAMKLRANAWARGDLATLRSLARPASASDDCALGLINAVSSGEIDQQGMRKVVEDGRREADIAGRQVVQNWLDAAQNALAKNASTFAVLPIDQIDRYAARLKEAGCTVESPD